jgi:2-oxo-3-hexenedioate decarboxylase
MLVEDGGAIDFARFVHPRVEPEIAFILRDSLPATVTPAAALAAVAAVAPALEIIDSRYKDFKFSLTDVVADNSSSSAFVVGRGIPVGPDLSNLGMLLEIDGAAGDIVMAGGATAAEHLAPGQHVRLRVQTIGAVEFSVRRP